jgi:hypothetical protein
MLSAYNCLVLTQADVCRVPSLCVLGAFISVLHGLHGDESCSQHTFVTTKSAKVLTADTPLPITFETPLNLAH